MVKKDGNDFRKSLTLKIEIYDGYTYYDHGRRRRQPILANVDPRLPKADVMGVGRSLIQLTVDRLKPICPVENMCEV